LCDLNNTQTPSERSAVPNIEADRASDRADPAGRFAVVYGMVSAALLVPDAGTRTAVLELSSEARAAAREAGGTELERAIARLADAFGSITDGELAAEHRRVFGHTISSDCPPYEAEWGRGDAFQHAQRLADVAGFYRAWGVREASARRERPDHAAAELEFAGFLAWKEAAAAEAEQAQIAREARQRFHKEHLGRFGPAFAAQLEKRSGYGPYLAAARALAALLEAERRALGIAAPEPGIAPRVPEERPEGACFECGESGVSALPAGSSDERGT
jgi:TorA maturation chaperone TorD